MKTARWEDPRVERPKRPWGRANRMENRLVWAEGLGRVPVSQPWGRPALYPQRTRGPGKNFKAGKRHDLVLVLEMLLQKKIESRQQGDGDLSFVNHRFYWMEMCVCAGIHVHIQMVLNTETLI